ncbi:imelysin family protein [Pseudoalteromonas sp. R3]|jgi:predicted lipoprotein|uniref:imelysin family protein n=1 Tax=Pseudoalteromonas sp. R3 TaxID=1709477 RepID=UPI0006B41E7E|nr:imelysin family protein [Pseudoalteromonas sp. R3]AZZ97723.1 peptidase M75 [Pseudoalteromonas sp. R3]
MRIHSRPILLAVAIGLALSGCGESTSSSAGPGYKQATNTDDNQDTGNDNQDTGNDNQDSSNGGSDTPDSGQDNNQGTFSQQKLIANLTDNVFTPTFQQFANKASAQPDIVKAYCDLETAFDPTLSDEAAKAARDEALLAAQNSWKETMVSWQHAELMIVGPLLADDKALRKDIYSWPDTNYCNVDQDVAYFAQGNINGVPYDISKRSDKRRGLDALEYLLFNNNLDHSCSAAAAGNILAQWNTQDEQQRRSMRCQYAVEASKDLKETAERLMFEWAGDQGYAAKLKNAGASGSEFATVTEAVNRISDALFYMTEELKDYKLATPLGLFANQCGTEVCPEAVESRYAKHSIENIQANIAAFEQIFLGQGTDSEDTIGFDDFLDNQSASQTKDVMIQGIANAKAATAALNDNLQQALNEDTAGVTNTHAKVKDVTDQLKNDFIQKLALELPKTSAGDND